jgi:hypothetical protein
MTDSPRATAGCGNESTPCEGWVFNPTYELTYWKYGLHVATQVRKTPSWSRSWANFSLL